MSPSITCRAQAALPSEATAGFTPAMPLISQ
jgi:hypothetical protein